MDCTEGKSEDVNGVLSEDQQMSSNEMNIPSGIVGTMVSRFMNNNVGIPPNDDQLDSPTESSGSTQQFYDDNTTEVVGKCSKTESKMETINKRETIPAMNGENGSEPNVKVSSSMTNESQDENETQCSAGSNGSAENIDLKLISEDVPTIGAADITNHPSSSILVEKGIDFGEHKNQTRDFVEDGNEEGMETFQKAGNSNVSELKSVVAENVCENWDKKSSSDNDADQVLTSMTNRVISEDVVLSKTVIAHTHILELEEKVSMQLKNSEEEPSSDVTSKTEKDEEVDDQILAAQNALREDSYSEFSTDDEGPVPCFSIRLPEKSPVVASITQPIEQLKEDERQGIVTSNPNEPQSSQSDLMPPVPINNDIPWWYKEPEVSDASEGEEEWDEEDWLYFEKVQKFTMDLFNCPLVEEDPLVTRRVEETELVETVEKNDEEPNEYAEPCAPKDQCINKYGVNLESSDSESEEYMRKTAQTNENEEATPSGSSQMEARGFNKPSSTKRGADQCGFSGEQSSEDIKTNGKQRKLMKPPQTGTENKNYAGSASHTNHMSSQRSCHDNEYMKTAAKSAPIAPEAMKKADLKDGVLQITDSEDDNNSASSNCGSYGSSGDINGRSYPAPTHDDGIFSSQHNNAPVTNGVSHKKPRFVKGEDYWQDWMRTAKQHSTVPQAPSHVGPVKENNTKKTAAIEKKVEPDEATLARQAEENRLSEEFIKSLGACSIRDDAMAQQHNNQRKIEEQQRRSSAWMSSRWSHQSQPREYQQTNENRQYPTQHYPSSSCYQTSYAPSGYSYGYNAGQQSSSSEFSYNNQHAAEYGRGNQYNAGSSSRMYERNMDPGQVQRQEQSSWGAPHPSSNDGMESYTNGKAQSSSLSHLNSAQNEIDEELSKAFGEPAKSTRRRYEAGDFEPILCIESYDSVKEIASKFLKFVTANEFAAIPTLNSNLRKPPNSMFRGFNPLVFVMENMEGVIRIDYIEHDCVYKLA